MKSISSLITRERVTTDKQDIAHHILNHFTNIFISNIPLIYDMDRVDKGIPSLIDNNINNSLSMIPSNLETKEIGFCLIKESAPGRYGFGPYFFQSFWNVIHLDVV